MVDPKRNGRKDREPNIGAMAKMALDLQKRSYHRTSRFSQLRRDNEFIDKVRELWGAGMDCPQIQARLRSQYYKLPVELIEDIVDDECTPFYSEAAPHRCDGCGAMICTDTCIACSVLENF